MQMNDQKQQGGPIVWNVVHLVTNRPWSTREAETRERRAALNRVQGFFGDLISESRAFDLAPFTRLRLIVGINVGPPKPPWLGKLSRKKQQIDAVAEFDWEKVRDLREDGWYRLLVPAVHELIRLAGEKYGLSLDRFERLYEANVAKPASMPNRTKD